MRKYEFEAARLAEAIRTLAAHPERLENMESYLEFHFGPWLEKYAYTPADMAREFLDFSTIEI